MSGGSLKISYFHQKIHRKTSTYLITPSFEQFYFVFIFVQQYIHICFFRTSNRLLGPQNVQKKKFGNGAKRKEKYPSTCTRIIYIYIYYTHSHIISHALTIHAQPIRQISYEDRRQILPAERCHSFVILGITRT